jgi:hypothetical protein
MRSERGSLHTVVGRRPCLVMTAEVIPIKRRAFRFSPDQGRCASAATVIRRPRTGRETSRNSATQRNPARTSDPSERQARGHFGVSAQFNGLGCIDLGDRRSRVQISAARQ